MYRDHLLPTAFEEEEEFIDLKKYRLGYFGGKCRMKKPGGTIYNWQELALAKRAAEQRETVMESELTDKAFKNRSEMMNAEEGSR